MKYIRTKDGRIYEIIEETENSFELCSPFEKKMGCSCTMIKRVLGSNQKPTYRLADTIEELCDELVFEWQRSSISHDNDTWHLYHEISLKEEVKNALTDGYRANIEQVKNIYAAIWTDKGLQYVARMNSEGELELL